MVELLILDFDGVDEADSLKVNEELGLDPKTGAGDWPAGLITRCGRIGRRPRLRDRGLGVAQTQADFMNSRLGAAMAGGGVTAVLQVTWAHNPGLRRDASGSAARFASGANGKPTVPVGSARPSFRL